MPQFIHLVRHGMHAEVGAILSGRSDIGLDARGRVEAASIAAAFDHAAIASLHSSPSRRAKETAGPVAAKLGLEIREASALDEIDFGDFAGRSFAELDSDPRWHRWNAERDVFRCPGGETMHEAAARAIGCLATLPARDLPALCVTHCDIIRGVIVRCLDLPFARMFELDCPTGSITTLERTNGRLRIAPRHRASAVATGPPQ